MASFLDDPHYLFTSESVTEGHPDKMCDQISDAILDAILADDPDARVACETATTTGIVLVLARSRPPRTWTSSQSFARPSGTSATPTPTTASTTRRAGTLVSVKEQSPDIAMGVDEVGTSSAPAIRG